MFIAIGVLIWLNPDMAAFESYVEDRSEEILLRETGDTGFGRFLSEIGGALAGTFVEGITEHNDYFLFSTYTLDFDGEEDEGEEWRFLGIGGQFIELERPEAIHRDEPEGKGN